MWHHRPVGVLVCLVLVLASCSDSRRGASTTIIRSNTTTTIGTSEETVAAAGDADFAWDAGVTAEPCTDVVNPDNRCITLGVVADFTGFAATALVSGVTAFWDRVNEMGGIGGLFDVALLPVDSGGEVGFHVEGYGEIADSVAALAVTMGTEHTKAILELLRAESVLAVPTSAWSGWSFADIDGGQVLESAAPVCFEAMNALDFTVQAAAQSFTFGIVAADRLDDADYAAGVRTAATAVGLGRPLFDLVVASLTEEGSLADALAAIDAGHPDVVFVAMGPDDLAALLTGVLDREAPVTFVGARSTWREDLVGRSPELDAALTARYVQSSPFDGWGGESPGHEAMRTAAADLGVSPNLAFLRGWVSQYPLLRVLQQAVADGTLLRSHLVEIAANLTTVDSEGMLADRSYVGDPAEITPRSTLMNRVDPEVPGLLTQAAPYFTGSAAAAYAFDAACATE